MTNAQAAITIHYRPATQADAEQCARVYNEGWILAFSESGLISQDIIKRANDTRLETLQRTLPTNGGPDATGSILIVAVATVDSKDQVVGVVDWVHQGNRMTFQDIHLNSSTCTLMPSFTVSESDLKWSKKEYEHWAGQRRMVKCSAGSLVETCEQCGFTRS
ncbi:hypothetical protein BCR33DRAFT_766167 [Rhizoclosmatium globosum]|uniref:Uncharacterized protein n=1 Tax=Rhizoclosmatium globosum TaxID=329046 RepID=A0A1Y2CAC6_9FUNG|nr:hypothetical protein BCR33DRAFT_766167 [Rhizoclosmatium globosum]|eukprot:ORY43979.1 hypothetical protein BCR33DRAFT_766167 [Rhizoclosmatium globosum]